MKFLVSLLAGISVIGVLGASASRAADLPPPPPPQYVEVVEGNPNCFYLRADVGASFSQDPSVTQLGGVGFTNEKLKDRALIEVGTGCQVTSNIRLEATAGYRFRSSLTEECGCLDADIETYTGFINAFWDITYFRSTGFTPYVGAGAGIAHHRFTNVNLPAGAGKGNSTDFAYNLTAGVSYDLTDNIKMDVAYRFVDLGVGVSEGTAHIRADNLRAHEVKLGVRYHFGDW